jgi:hypothetical protein
MGDQRSDRDGGVSVRLHVVRVLAAAMLMWGTVFAVAETNYLYDGAKGHLYPDWPAVVVSSAVAIAGGMALFFI